MCKEALASFVFPSHCIHCEDEVESRKLLCSFCSSLIEQASLEDPFSLSSSALEPEGPCLSLIRAKDGSYSEEIAKTMAAFMVVALGRLDWPIPDCIIPSPRDMKFNLLLARFLSDFIQVPVVEALKVPAAFQREEGFLWKRSLCLSDQNVLIIDTQRDISKDPFVILDEAGIAERYFLSFC